VKMVVGRFEWRVPGIRRWRRRNGRFGSHQGMWLDPADPGPGKSGYHSPACVRQRTDVRRKDRDDPHPYRV